MRKISGLSVFCLLFLASLIIYFNSITGDFLFDDKLLIVNNEFIKHINTIPLLFTTRVFHFAPGMFENIYNYYRPMQTFSFAIDHALWGLNAFGYHLANIAIHSLNAFLVFYLIFRLFSNFSLALLSSVLFCIHPIQTESVSYISGRSELLVSLFTLSTLVFYIRYASFSKGRHFLISLFSFVFALLSREAGFFVFVPFFVAYIGIKSKVSKAAVLSHFISFSGILFIYIKLRLTVLVPIQVIPLSPFPFSLDVVNFLNVLAQYSKLFIFPHSLHILRCILPVSSFKDAAIISPAFFLILTVFLCVMALRKKKYALLFGAGWFILTLSYLIRFMYKFSYCVTMEEHWVYLASIGFFVIAAYLILSIRRFKRVCIISIISFYSVISVINSGHWKNELDFYRYNLKHIMPSFSFLPRLNFSSALAQKGLHEEALEQARLAVAIAPSNPFAYIELGYVYHKMKKFPEARQAYLNALEIDYFCWQANLRLKVLAEETGEEFKDDIDPKLPAAESAIVKFIRLGEFDKALDLIEAEMAKSATPQLYTLSGITFGKLGLYRQAQDAFNDALKIDPHNRQALYNLAVIYESRHEKEKLGLVRKRLEGLKK